jgi:hypothetical protein
MAIKYPSLTPTSKDIPESQMAAIRKRLYKKWTPEQIKYETEPTPFSRQGVPRLAKELSYIEEMPIFSGGTPELGSAIPTEKTFSIRRYPMPSPEGLLEYMPGRATSRLPSYTEYSGQEDITGPWGQERQQNLNAALQNYIQGYKGKTAPWSLGGAEAGIVGLPQPLAQEYLGQMKAIAEQKAEEARVPNKAEIIQWIVSEYDPATDTTQTIIDNALSEGVVLNDNDLYLIKTLLKGKK